MTKCNTFKLVKKIFQSIFTDFVFLLCNIRVLELTGFVFLLFHIRILELIYTLVAWISRNYLLKKGAISQDYVTATGLEPQTLSS